MPRTALVVLWLCAASAFWQGCASAQSSRYAMSPPSTATGSVAPEPAPSAAPATASVEEGGATVADADEPRSERAPAQAPQPAAPARALPGVTRATGPAGNTGATGPAGNTGAQQTAAQQPAAQQPAAPAPMLVYTADIDIQTPREQVVATIDRIIEAATAMGGYLLRRTDASVQVRIPSARFRDSLRRVEEFGEVLHRSVAAQDVSEEYRDLEVRLQNLRAVRRRLEEFLARAGSMADALQVERELERITREIDTIEGRLRFLSTRVSFSLVTVNVHARPEPSVAAGPAMPPRRTIDLPVEWFRRLGLERLLNTSE